MRTARTGRLLLAGALLLPAGCELTPVPDAADHAAPAAAAEGPGHHILVAGERVDVGTPVVLFSDPGGFDAYVPGPVFASEGPAGLRYTPGRAWAAPGTRPDGSLLAQGLHQLVLHYDACGFSQRCFRLLQDERVLSAHFLLDVDGTLYQTLDLADQAWHGRSTNATSIGIELAHIGAYPAGEGAPDPYNKRRWYVPDDGRLRLEIPAELGPTHIRTPGPFFAARPTPVTGSLHGQALEQADFTPQQYAALVKLCVVLRRLFPRIALELPRDAQGRLETGVLPPERLAAFCGILGHWHVTIERIDPGPAFDWERLLREVAAAEAQEYDGSGH